MSTRPLPHDFFLLNYITMVPQADVDTITNTNSNNTSIFRAIRPGHNHNGASSINWRRRHAFRMHTAIVTLLLLGFHVASTITTQDEYPSHTQHHHGPSIHKPPWPPPPLMLIPWSQFDTTLKLATTESDGLRAHPCCALLPVIDVAIRKRCPTEIFSQDLGLRHLTSFRFFPDNLSQPHNSDIADGPYARNGDPAPSSDLLILLQNTLFLQSYFYSPYQALTMTTRPSRKAPSSLLSATQASSARTRSSSRLKSRMPNHAAEDQSNPCNTTMHINASPADGGPVSYTHLTLPTNREV